jgi:triphosphoribosyl-dephospho-CoA synthase
MNPAASMLSRSPARQFTRVRQSSDTFVCEVARAAIHGLYEEVMIGPKPGLVTRIDNGSHRDMDASTFVRSLFSLRHYFADVTRCGQQHASFPVLQNFGVAAEHRMLKATRGINTHRGAIFSLGLLAAAAGRLYAEGTGLDVQALCNVISRSYGADILASANVAPPSHGKRAAAQYGIEGAREVAAGGYQILVRIAVPTFEESLASGCPRSVAAVQSLFAVMAAFDDTNVFYRGGREGIDCVKRMSRAFLDEGGVFSPHWHQHAMAIHARFVEHNLSPGGAADILAATLFVHALQRL